MSKLRRHGQTTTGNRWPCRQQMRHRIRARSTADDDQPTIAWIHLTRVPVRRAEVSDAAHSERRNSQRSLVTAALHGDEATALLTCRNCRTTLPALQRNFRQVTIERMKSSSSRCALFAHHTASSPTAPSLPEPSARNLKIARNQWNKISKPQLSTVLAKKTQTSSQISPNETTMNITVDCSWPFGVHETAPHGVHKW